MVLVNNQQIYEVANKTTSILFSTKKLAEEYICQAGSVTLDLQIYERTLFTPEIGLRDDENNTAQKGK